MYNQPIKIVTKIITINHRFNVKNTMTSLKTTSVKYYSMLNIKL